MQFLSEIFKYRSLKCFLSLDKTFVYSFSHLFNDENIKQTCFHTGDMFAFCFGFFGENTRKKRSNILFFSGVKVVEQKKSIFLVEKNCTRKKGKIHLRNQNSSFFFFLRLSRKTFSFFFHVCFAIRIFPSWFFSHL